MVRQLRSATRQDTFGQAAGLGGAFLLAATALSPLAAQADAGGESHGAHGHHIVTTTTTAAPGNGGDVQAPSGSGGANQDCGAYCPSGVGLPSGNGNGDGQATGKPCAGCVGNADGKNPPGQAHDGTDHNNGYECDGNNGIGKTNPAHSGCHVTTSTTQPHVTTTTAPPSTTTTSPSTTSTTVGSTTTTSVAGGTTTTTNSVLGVQFNRPASPGATALARTGSLMLSPLFALGLLLVAAGFTSIVHARRKTAVAPK